MSEPTKTRPGDQRIPDGDGPSMHDEVIKLIESRRDVGIERYGQSLRTLNGRDTLQDLQEELADALVYITSLRMAVASQQDRLVEVVRRELSATSTDLDLTDKDRAVKVVARLQDALFPAMVMEAHRAEHPVIVSTGTMPQKKAEPVKAASPSRDTLLAAARAPRRSTGVRGATFTIRFPGKCPGCQGSEGWLPEDEFAMQPGEQGGFVDDEACCFDCWERADEA